MRRKVLHEPWRTFFEALDQELSSPCDLHCFGGFVLTEHYGVAQPTIDVDVVDVRGAAVAEIARRAGRGSPLHRRHRAYIDLVTIAEVPDDYESRLIDMHVEGLAHVRLLAFERHTEDYAALTIQLRPDSCGPGGCGRPRPCGDRLLPTSTPVSSESTGVRLG